MNQDFFKLEQFNSSYWKNISILQRNNDNLNHMMSKLTYQSYSPIILIRIVLTILLRIGFIFVHIGSVPVTNVNLILLQNLVDFCWSTFVYFLVGFIFSYSGDSNNSLIGGEHWIGEGNINKTEALIGWQAVSVTSAISTSGVIGRLHTIGCLISTIILSGLVQPLIIHWAWTLNGWMIKNNFFGKKVSFKDHSGAAIIHVVGGLSALIGCLTLGRRILKLKDIDNSSIPSSSPAIVFAGYFFIFLGLQGISSIDDPDKMEQGLINNLLSASSSVLVVITLHFLLSGHFFDYWKITRCIQSIISGLVAISACPDSHSPIISILFGSLSGFIFFGVSEMVFKSALEDNCNIISTHLITGLFGSLLAPLSMPATCVYTSREGKTIWIDIMWQANCLIAIMGTIIIIMVPIYLLLKIFGCLRNRSEFFNHLQSTVALKKGPFKFQIQRIFSQEKENTIFLKPGSVSNLIKKNFNESFFESVPRNNFLTPQKEISEPIGENKVVTDLRITEEKHEESLQKTLHLEESRMKKKRNVYTIHESYCSDTGSSNFQKNLIDLKAESQNKFCSFQGLGAGDSLFNQQLVNEKVNKYEEKKQIQENENKETNVVKLRKKRIKVNDPLYEIHKTSKLTNLAESPLSKSSVEFLFGPKENFPSSEYLNENVKHLRKNFSEINLELVSDYSSQQTPIRKSF